MRSLRSRLFLAIGVSVLVTIVITLGLGTFLARRSIERAVLRNMARQADLVAVRASGGPIPAEQLGEFRRFFAGQGERLAVLPRPLPALAQVVIPAEIRQSLDAGHSTQGVMFLRRTRFLYAARPAGSQAVVLFRPARLGVNDWRPYVGSFLLAGLVGLGTAALASLLLARTVARPVRRVADGARALAAGAAPRTVPVEGSEELRSLAWSFNDMAADLSAAREAEQGFLLSVSHELKTPLTAIRGYAEGLEEGAVEPAQGGEVIGREAARLERSVQDLLDLARLNRRTFTIRREPVDLAEVAGEAVRRYAARAEGFEVALEARCPEPAPALGDQDRVLQVVSNLVENALRVTPSGGAVVVTASPGMVAVSDTGPGLSAEDVGRAFERFFLYRRYGGERPVGSGLGLAVVKELTEAMGGRVEVQSAPGRGSVFTVLLPAAPAAPPPWFWAPAPVPSRPDAERPDLDQEQPRGAGPL